MTFQEMYNFYFQVNRPFLSKQTARSYKSMYKKYLYKFKNSDLATLHLIDYQNFINKLLDIGLKPKTVKNYKAFISTMYNTLIKHEKATKNPVHNVRIPKFDNFLYFNFDVDYQKRVIRAIKNYDEKPFCDILLFLLHGRRLNEVLSMTWDMVNLPLNSYIVPAKINKAKKNMIYKMSDELRDVLIPHYNRAVEREKTFNPIGYIFTNRLTGTRYKDCRRALFRFLYKNNLPHMTFHQIRHLIGGYSINHLKIPIEQVSYTLGHTDIKITQRYINSDPMIAKNLADKVFASV